jgi:hypothetical protein
MTFKRWLISLTLLLLFISSTFAQDAEQPIIIIKGGDLWDWTGGPALRQKTQWGYNSGIEISPITDEVAYSSVATVVVDHLRQANEGYAGAPLPNNLWVITIGSSDEAYRIADQPANASFMVPGVPDTTITRSGPIWSPNGQEIAWTEQITPGGLMYRVMIYDKATQTTRTLPTEIGTEDKSLPGIWTDAGLVMTTYTFNNSTITFEPTYVVLDPTTGEQKTMIKPMPILTANGTQRPMNAIPVQYEGGTWLAILYMGDLSTPSRWILYNLETGEQRDAPNPPTATRFFEDGHSAITVKAQILNNEVLSYDVFAPDGSWVQLTTNYQKYVSNFAISWDGQAIAYQLGTLGTVDRDSTIYVWRNGVIGTVPQTGGLGGAQEFAWAKATWFIK